MARAGWVTIAWMCFVGASSLSSAQYWTLFAQEERQQAQPASRDDQIHAKLFNGLGTQNRLLETLGSVERTVDRISVDFVVKTLPETAALLSCVGDIAVKGVVRDVRSLLTGDGRFLFSTYRVDVQRVIWNRTKTPVSVETTIVLVRSGGRITVGGTVVEATDNEYPSLDLGGTYVFIGNFIPETGAVRSAHADATFTVKAGTVKQTGLPFDRLIEQGVPSEDFERELRSAKCPRR